MFEKIIDKQKRKKEKKRLEELFPDFLKEYRELCEKYQAGWQPVIHQLDNKSFILKLLLQTYIPNPTENKNEKSE